MRAITEEQLRTAVARAGLPDEVFTRLHAELEQEPEQAARFEPAHIAYYLGALLIIGAMGWFITKAWDELSGATLTGIAFSYALVFGWSGYAISKRAFTRVPGGILVTIAVTMMPMIVYGVERQLGWWPADDPGKYSDFHPYIRAGWVLMELFTILGSFVALRFVRFAFVTAPGAYALWYLSMDGTALLFGRTWTFHDKAWISVGFGLVMMTIAYLLEDGSDYRAGVDLSFWFYLFGLLTFTGGLSVMDSGSQVGKAVYCLLHLLIIGLSLVLQRRVFLVFGALGVLLYVGSQAHLFFNDSISFTFGLTVIGILFIGAGLLWKRHEADLSNLLAPLIPKRIRHRHAVSA